MANLTSLSAIGGERLLRTNPVRCLDQLLAEWEGSDATWLTSPGHLRAVLSALAGQGVRVPIDALRRWTAAGYLALDFASLYDAEGPMPRVVGLAVDPSRGDGYILPLCPVFLTPPSQWRIDPTLPFSADGILDGLVGLLQSSGLTGGDVVPERLAFEFENSLGLQIKGESMTIAAILAVLDRLGEQSNALLGSAVALVELLPGGRLGPVAETPKKLEAAYRECGHLSLVVGPPGLSIDPGRAGVIWAVESLADLARCLTTAGLLDPLLNARGPLTRAEAVRVLDRLRWQVAQEHRYREAAEFGDRIRRVGPAGPPDPTVWSELTQLQASAYRHHGRFAEATSLAAETHRRVAALGELSTDDEEADVAAEYAAALFIGHRFAVIPELLKKWVTAIEIDPRRFRPLTRVKVWNTLGRALAILGSTGWDELFGRSFALNRGLGDEENVDRTTHYRVHALLRHGQVFEARQAFIEAGRLARPEAAGDPWAAFCQANIARLEGCTWEDHPLEERLWAGMRPYSVWLYVQATARQPGRAAADVRRRLGLAVDLLKQQAGGLDGNICNLFASVLGAYAAARDGDEPRWQAAIDATVCFLATTDSDIRRHYDPAMGSSLRTPDLRLAEALLERVPYF